MDTVERDVLDEWAAVNGLDSSSLIALMCVVMRGLVTPNFELSDHGGVLPPPPCHVGLVDEDMTARSMLDRLLRPPHAIQQILVKKFSKVDAKYLKLAWTGSCREGPGPGNSDSDDHRSREYHDKLVEEAEQGVHSFLNEQMKCLDMVDNYEALGRIELIVRPRFVIENVCAGGIAAELAQCHRATGLLVGGDALRIGALDRKDVREIEKVLAGLRVPVPSIFAGTNPKATEPASATLLLQGSASEWHDPMVAGLREEFLLLRPRLVDFPDEPDFGAIEKALETWTELVKKFLDLRRWGVSGTGSLADWETSKEFAKRHQVYLGECSENRIRARSVRELPRMIAWLLISFFGSIHRDLVVERAFRHAEILRDGHLAVMEQMKRQSEFSRTILLASRLHDKIKRKQPVTLRTLVRSFDEQKTGIYLPTLELMLKAGVIVEESTEEYRLGGETDLEGSLRRVSSEARLRIVA